MYIVQYTVQVHCKDTVPKIGNKYSQKWNCAASFPFPTFMYLWAIFYIFPRSVRLFCCSKIGGPCEYINRSQIHECWNREWGCAVSFLEIHKWILFAVYSTFSGCQCKGELSIIFYFVNIPRLFSSCLKHVQCNSENFVFFTQRNFEMRNFVNRILDTQGTLIL